MKSFLRYFSLCVLFAVFPFGRLQAQGNNNPTGVSGDFNGRVDTAGSYDPYTGNARRTVHDITAAGSVGSYPLRWTRYSNSRHALSSGGVVFGQGGYWTHSYQWSIDLSYNVSYPDGRVVSFLDQIEVQPGIYQGPPGVPDRLQVVTPPVGNSLGEYDLLLADGGRVCLRHSSPGPYFVVRTAKIVDPYGLETNFQYGADGGLFRIVEPAGRYLEINRVTLPWAPGFKVISSVQAFDGRGNMTQSVTYNYTQAQVPGNYFTQLSSVDYSDGTHASYTYQNDRLLSTCNDVRYPGAMSKIRYEYIPHGTQDVAFGQLKAERNLTTNQIVSQIAYNGDVSRTETRGDGPSRTFTYNSDGRLVSYTDFKGQPSYISYDGNSYPWAFTDARGKVTTTLREGIIGAISVLTHPDNSTVGFDYQDHDNPYFVTIRGDERGKNTYFVRNGNHRITDIYYPDYQQGGAHEAFTYTPLGQVETHLMTSGGTETFAYDTRGLLTSYTPPITPSDPSPQSHPTRYFYYESGPHTDRLRYVVDPRGNATWFDYNLRGLVTKVTHQDGTYTQSGYNGDGTLAWSADENHPGAANNENERTRYTYDEYKRVTAVMNPLNQQTTISYALDWANPLVHTTRSIKYVTSPMNKNIVYDYDENFRKIDQVVALGTADEAWTLFQYDAVGNLTSTTDPRWNTTTLAYDDRNRRIRSTAPVPFNNQVTQWEYDPTSNLTKEIRPDLSYRRWEYDSMNRVVRTFGFANEQTNFARDLAGNVWQMTDAKGASYYTAYDALNRRTNMIYPPDASGAYRYETWHYDTAGNLDQYTNPAGQVQTLSCDNRNRLSGSSWSSGSAPSATLQYDAASRLTSVVTNSGETTVGFGYDAANRKIWEDQTLAGYPTRRVQTPRDLDGNRSALEVSSYYVLKYDYTQRNQLFHIRDANNNPFYDYTYDVAGHMINRQGWWPIPNGVNFHYDQLNRVNQVEQGDASVVFARSYYQYDALNREVATWRDEQAGKGERFWYNAPGQLTAVVHNADNVQTGNPSNWSLRRDYNYTPDFLNWASVNDNGFFAPFANSALNQYTSVNNRPAEYDNRFNLYRLDGLQFDHNASNKLISVTGNGHSAQFTYDGLGRCVRRVIDGNTILFTYDGWNPILEWDQWGNWRTSNIYGAGPDELLSRHDATFGPLIYKQDKRGSVVFLLNGANQVVEKYTYDAFGNPTVTNGDGSGARKWSNYGNRFMFTGREYIKELDIYDYRHRFYQPGIGRFLEPDPIGFRAGDANLFRYCGGDPVNRTDPTGLIVVTGRPIGSGPRPGRGNGPANGNDYIDFAGAGDVSAGPDEPAPRPSLAKQGKQTVWYGNMTPEEYEEWAKDAPETDSGQTHSVTVVYEQEKAARNGNSPTLGSVFDYSYLKQQLVHAGVVHRDRLRGLKQVGRAANMFATGAAVVVALPVAGPLALDGLYAISWHGIVPAANAGYYALHRNPNVINNVQTFVGAVFGPQGQAPTLSGPYATAEFNGTIAGLLGNEAGLWDGP